MPRTRIDALAQELKRPEIPAPMYLKELFLRYAKAYGMSCAEIGAALGCSAANVSQLLNRPTARWTVSQIGAFCDVLHVPISEAVAATQLGGGRS